MESSGRQGQLGPYVVGEMVGEGGMGRVFKSVDEGGRTVALKVLRAELAGDQEFRIRFEREVKLARRVSHTHVVETLDWGEVDGHLYLAQEFVDGHTLRQRLTESGILDVSETVRLAGEIGAGLNAIHEIGLVHRDVKPDNILLDAGGSVRLADFGLAKDTRARTVVTRLGETVGSVEYMSPEQIRGDSELGPRTDVYSMACVIWECLIGTPPFPGRGGMKGMWAHLYEEPEDPINLRPDLPTDLVWALKKGIEKAPADRPRSAEAFARILQAGA